MKTEMFQPVLKWLEAGAIHTSTGIGFNMNEFVEDDAFDFEGKNCGTSCCIAGAVQQFNKLKGFDKSTVVKEIFRLGEFLGMTEEQSLRLFFAADRMKEPDEYGSVYPNTGALVGQETLSGISPQRAAKTLRRFMETGEVVWE